MSPWLLGVGALAAGVAGLFLLDRLSMAAVRPVRRPLARTPEAAGLTATPFETLDSPTVRGWWIEPSGAGGSGGTAVAVLAHGWGANCAILLPVAEALAGAGHPTLVFDYPGHGRSGDVPYMTVRHYRDQTKRMLRAAAARYPDRPVIAVGHSMGGAASTLAVADGAPAHGLALVAAPADVLQVTAAYLSHRGLPGRLLVRVFLPFWRRRVGVPFRRLVPERHLARIELPVLVAQPEHDHRVPWRHAERLARAAGVEVHRVEGATHSDILRRGELHRELLALTARVEEEWRDGG